MVISFWRRLLDVVSPRSCVVCGGRLTVSEEVLCGRCNLHLPRTGFHLNAYENELARMFWGKIAVERASALFYFESHAETANILYELKYKDHPEIGEVMGRITARELHESGFFDGIDVIVPVPLTRQRERQRGYNQSLLLARGISGVTGLPVLDKVVARTTFTQSQTQMGRWERRENVEGAFRLVNAAPLQGRHILLVDDVITTGATMTACAKELLRAPGSKASLLALGFAKT